MEFQINMRRTYEHYVYIYIYLCVCVNEMITCVVAKYVKSTTFERTEKVKNFVAHDIKVNRIGAWERKFWPHLVYATALMNIFALNVLQKSFFIK